MKNNESESNLMIQRNQLELNFSTQPCRPTGIRRQRRQNRARWWFHQMHRVVEQAVNWETTPPARPAQEYMPLDRAA